jgi:hypothetical protein
MDDKLKWVYAAGGLGLLGYAVGQFLSESAKASRAARRRREPWEME